MSKRKKHGKLKHVTFGQGLAMVLLFLLALLFMVPIIFTFLYSFFSPGEISAYSKLLGNGSPDFWLDILYSPNPFSLEQYYKILISQPQYLQYFINSVKYAGIILLGQALIVPLMAYGLSRFTFKFRDGLFFAILMLMLLPFQVTMVPSVLTLRKLNLMDSPWAVIIPMWFSPFYIFLLRQFMIGLPNELMEAGMIDGAGPLRCYVQVVIPVCRPILGAAVALSFADCWNMVEQPLVYLANNLDANPLSVLFNQISKEAVDVAFAGAALYILPALLIYFYFQEDILMGVQLSELK
ncbi:MAG: carbohydrate ABC transporter permease [Clostridiales bacterium]|nr:carbohydrate ABC transporter permease [Clostridiales bacterium]